MDRSDFGCMDVLFIIPLTYAVNMLKSYCPIAQFNGYETVLSACEL